MRDRTSKEIRGAITDLWVELGRDASKLSLKDKTKKELLDILEKLKAINYSFSLLFSVEDNTELAIEVLKNVFNERRR